MASSCISPEISILLVDDDAICLSILSGVLQKMKHHVVAVTSPIDALTTLRMKRNSFDLILTDVHMPEMSGLELLKHVEEEFKLPVVLMSADHNKGIMLKALQEGAEFYFVKPISQYNLSRLWQFAFSSTASTKTNNPLPSVDLSPVVARAPNTLGNHDQQRMVHVNNNNNNNINNINNFALLFNNKYKGNTSLFFGNNGLKRPMDEEDMGASGKSACKKQKLVWTTSLHNKFLEAVNTIGLDKSVPKKILEFMNVPGLKRENVASHLQKYRLFLKRMAEARSSMQNGIPNLNERPFRSSFVWNEITFFTSNIFHQHYQEYLAQAQGFMNAPMTYENGQSSNQGTISFADHNPMNIAPGDHIYSNEGAQTPNQIATNLGVQLPTLESYQQGFPGGFSLDQQGQSSQDGWSLSNHIQPTPDNKYVGLRIGANGELVGPLQNTPTVHEYVADNNANVANGMHGGMMHGSNHTDEIGQIANAQEVNYEMNFDYNNNSLQINAPFVDDFSGLDDWSDIYISASLDHNANATQQGNSFGMSQDMPNLHGTGDDELRELAGIDIQADQETFGNDSGFGSFGGQNEAQESLFEGLDQGVASNDDNSFDCYFAQEFNGNQQDGGLGGAEFTKPN